MKRASLYFNAGKCQVRLRLTIRKGTKKKKEKKAVLLGSSERVINDRNYIHA